MKPNLINKYILCLFCGLAFCMAAKAQSDICDTAGIHTDPFHPVNPQKPSAKNYFNWMLPPSFYDFWCYPSYGASPYTIVSPWYENYSNNPFDKYANGSFSDNKPEDGWELFKQNLGRLDNDTTQRQRPLTLPYFIVYNRYTGVLNLFCALEQWSDYDYVFAYINQYHPGQNGLSASAFFGLNSGLSQPLDQKTYYTGLTMGAVPTNVPSAFFWYQFLAAYDPCVCEHRSTIDAFFGFQYRNEIYNIGGTEFDFSTPGSEYSDQNDEENNGNAGPKHNGFDPNGNQLPEYPAYNEVLGTFALLQTPTIQRFDSVVYKAGRGISLAKHAYKIASPPVYAFNPIMHEDTNKTVVKAAVYLKYKGKGNPGIHTLERINFNPIDSNYDFISTLVPVDCATSLVSAIVHSDNWDLTENYDVYLRFGINFVSTDIGSNGKQNQSYLEFTYPVNIDVMANRTLTNDPLYTTPPCNTKDPAQTHEFVKQYCSGAVPGLSYKAYLLNDSAPGQHIVQNYPLPVNNVFQIYPNPARNEAALELNLSQQSSLNMFICDAQGKVLKRPFENREFPAGRSDFAIDISGISAGVYFCTIYNKSINQVKKLVVINK